MRRPNALGATGQVTPHGGGSSSARPVSRMRYGIFRKWPAVVALIAAWPVGVAAAAPGFNSGDLLVWGIAALFVWGVSR